MEFMGEGLKWAMSIKNDSFISKGYLSIKSWKIKKSI